MVKITIFNGSNHQPALDVRIKSFWRFVALNVERLDDLDVEPEAERGSLRRKFANHQAFSWSLVAMRYQLLSAFSLAENLRMSSSNGWNNNLTEDESVAKFLNQR